MTSREPANKGPEGHTESRARTESNLRMDMKNLSYWLSLWHWLWLDNISLWYSVGYCCQCENGSKARFEGFSCVSALTAQDWSLFTWLLTLMENLYGLCRVIFPSSCGFCQAPYSGGNALKENSFSMWGSVDYNRNLQLDYSTTHEKPPSIQWHDKSNIL